MSDTDKPKVEVAFTPGKFADYYNDQPIVVVIDVLRATSAICAAFANGVSKIIPVASLDEAKAYQAQGYLVGAEREGKIVEGFSFGNSPYTYIDQDYSGKTIVLTTTNGTKAITVASEAPQVAIGSLVNLDALSNWLCEQNQSVLLLASGWKDKFNLEDTICAGAIAERLMGTGAFQADQDSTIAARYLYKQAEQNYFGFLKASSHRRRLRKLNLNRDVSYCLTPNQVDVVPVVQEGAIVPVVKGMGLGKVS